MNDSNLPFAVQEVEVVVVEEAEEHQHQHQHQLHLNNPSLWQQMSKPWEDSLKSSTETALEQMTSSNK
jgi:hypothetical protein